MNRLQESLDLDSTMYETYYNLGIASINAKKYEKAIEAFEGGIKIKPDFADFYYSLGVAQADLADELVEETEDKKEITEEDKLKAVELKKSAVENLTKYLELKPTAEDKKTIEELIEESNSFVNGDDNSAKEDAE